MAESFEWQVRCVSTYSTKLFPSAQSKKKPKTSQVREQTLLWIRGTLLITAFLTNSSRWILFMPLSYKCILNLFVFLFIYALDGHILCYKSCPVYPWMFINGCLWFACKSNKSAAQCKRFLLHRQSQSSCQYAQLWLFISAAVNNLSHAPLNDPWQ